MAIDEILTAYPGSAADARTQGPRRNATTSYNNPTIRNPLDGSGSGDFDPSSLAPPPSSSSRHQIPTPPTTRENSALSQSSISDSTTADIDGGYSGSIHPQQQPLQPRLKYEIRQQQQQANNAFNSNNASSSSHHLQPHHQNVRTNSHESEPPSLLLQMPMKFGVGAGGGGGGGAATGGGDRKIQAF